MSTYSGLMDEACHVLASEWVSIKKTGIMVPVFSFKMALEKRIILNTETLAEELTRNQTMAY